MADVAPAQCERKGLCRRVGGQVIICNKLFPWTVEWASNVQPSRNPQVCKRVLIIPPVPLDPEYSSI